MVLTVDNDRISELKAGSSGTTVTVHGTTLPGATLNAESDDTTKVVCTSVTVDETVAHPNWEVDAWRWFSLEEARDAIRPASLAAAFLHGWLDGGVYPFADN